MELAFRGWKREQKEHSHSVMPVTMANGQYMPGDEGDPLTWTSGLVAYGKVEDLGLSGSFLVEFNFDQKELRNWLKQFVISKPEAAIKLLAAMQGEAILALARKMEERAAGSLVVKEPEEPDDATT